MGCFFEKKKNVFLFLCPAAPIRLLLVNVCMCLHQKNLDRLYSSPHINRAACMLTHTILFRCIDPNTHIQLSVHLFVHSVFIEVDPQVRSSCGSCSAEFCYRPLISFTLILPKAVRALKRESPLSQPCQEMPLQFTVGDLARERERGGCFFFVSIKMKDYSDCQRSYAAIR